MTRNSFSIPAGTWLLLALAVAGCARSTEAWEEDLGSKRGDLFHRGMAAIALAEQAPDRAHGAVMQLLGLLDGPEGPLRRHAPDALVKIAPYTAEEMVHTLTRTTYISDDVRVPLEDAIASAGERAVPPLLAEMRDPHRLGARQVGLVLARIGDPAVDPLLEIVRQESGSRLAMSAMWTLGRCGPLARRALPVILERLRGDDPPTAIAAAECVWRIDPEGGISLPALREALASPRQALRWEAAKSITHLRVIRAGRSQGAERDEALAEILRFGEPVHPSLFEELDCGDEGRERAALACLLGITARWTVLPLAARGPTAPLPMLQERLGDSSEAVRSSAAFDLGRRGTGALPGLPWLIRSLEDRVPSVRTGVALAIALIVIDTARAHGVDGSMLKESAGDR
jgi:HEAT repeat protein